MQQTVNISLLMQDLRLRANELKKFSIDLLYLWLSDLSIQNIFRRWVNNEAAVSLTRYNIELYYIINLDNMLNCSITNLYTDTYYVSTINASKFHLGD